MADIIAGKVTRTLRPLVPRIYRVGSSRSVANWRGSRQVNIETMELLDAASEGDAVRVERLVSVGANVEVTDDQGWTSLTQAARGGHLDVVRYLVEQGADVNARDSLLWTPLMWAAENGHLDVVRFLMKCGVTVDASDSDNRTLFMCAARGGHLEVVRYLVGQGAAVDAHDMYGETPLMQGSENGHLDAVRYLVEHGATVDAHNSQGVTPLMKAAVNGHLGMIQFLVELGAAVDASDNDGVTPLMRAAAGGHLDVVQFLVEYGAAVDASEWSGQTPLMRAAKNGQLDVVRYLMKKGAAVHASDSDGVTPLMWAASDGNLDVVRVLVEQGATVDAHDNQGVTPLVQAARGGHFDVVRFLVQLGAAVDACGSDGETPLIRAAYIGHLDIVRILVEHGATVAASDNDGWTPLNRAAISGNLDMVRFLMEHGATVDASTSIGWTPLMLAATHSHMDVVRFLVDQGATVNPNDSAGGTPLNEAARVGHLDMVRFLVEHGATVDTSDFGGYTPLMQAARSSHLDVVRFLVERGAPINGREWSGWTPLMWAVENDNLEMVRILLEHGATVDDRNDDGETSLMQATNRGYLEVVQYLVEQGAAMDASDNDGKTSLMRAACGGHFDVVRFLVEHGAVVDASDNDGKTSLRWAAYVGHLNMERILVEHGAAVDASDNDGETPLMQAAEFGQLDMVILLVEQGASVDTHDSQGVTPLMRAARGGHLDVVRFLVEQGAVVDASDNQGVTPILPAARGGHLDVVRVLLGHGADVDASDNDGETPLMQAAEFGQLDMVILLVEQGASVDTHDSQGVTPLMRAARGGHLDVVRFLVEQGAVVDAHDNQGVTPILPAARGGHLDVVRVLLGHGADVDARDNDGETPLMQAAEFGHLDVVHLLVERGAKLNLESTAGNNALTSATEYDHQNIVQFLLPLVRYQDRRTQTEHLDEHVTGHSIIPSSWLIPPFEIEVEQFTDADHIGGDFRGRWLDADVAVKLFVVVATSSTIVDEVCLWHQLRHPNVLKLYGVCNSHHQFFVCEYASNGSLPEYLKSCDAKSRTPWKFLYEAALGLEYLHERKIAHGNLRGSNILIGSDGMAKLSGFRLSAPSSEGGWHPSGEWVRWAAPENLKGEQVSLVSDVYSLGMCILEAVSGRVPLYEWNALNLPTLEDTITSFHLEKSHQLSKLTKEQEELVVAMCSTDPLKRWKMPAVVDRLERFAEMESAKLAQETAQPDPELFVNLDAFDEFDHAKTTILWNQVQALVVQSENSLYLQLWHELKLIYDTLKVESHPWSTLGRFHDLLSECQLALDGMSQQNRICRLSATRARDYSVEGLHRRISQLLDLVCPQEHDAETRETEWKRLCREQTEIFVSEASEACVMLSSVDSEEDRSALVAVLRAELRNTDRKYTEKQLAVLQETCDDIVSKSLEDVKLATTPVWFIPWFELEMNEMKTLGVGGFGSVIKAKWLDSEVVVKKLEIADKDAANADKKREMRQMFEREVDIWFGLSHPHVVRLFGACHVGRPFFVCELAPNGTLVEYLRKHPDELWLKLREAALGVQYLHARGIVHGDLKCNNILIGSDEKAKVTDFGLSGVFGDDSTDMVVSEAMHWVAPECMLKQKPTFASDIYSLAMCIIEALRVTNGDEDDLPWGKLPNAAVKFNVTRRHRLPPRPRNCLDETWTLIERMCKSDPADRMLIMTVVNELENLAGRHEDLSGETDYVVIDNGSMRLSSSSVAHTLAEMKQWIANCDKNRDWEMDTLKSIYQLLWDRLEQVTTRLFPDGDDTVVNNTTTNDFSTFVEQSKQRTRGALGITGDIPLIKFTELALGGYALHRRLDKFMAAHAVVNEPSSLHDWTSACSAFMGVSNSPTLAFSDGDCSAKEETGGGTRMASSTEVVATL